MLGECTAQAWLAMSTNDRYADVPIDVQHRAPRRVRPQGSCPLGTASSAAHPRGSGECHATVEEAHSSVAELLLTSMGFSRSFASAHSRSSSAFRDLPGVARRSPTPLDRDFRQGSMPLLGDDNDYLPAGGDGYDAERGSAIAGRDGSIVSGDGQRNELKRSNASGSDRRVRTDSLSSSRYSSSADDSQTRVARSQEETASVLKSPVIVSGAQWS